MAGRLNGKVAIITGAGSGTGLAAATLFAKEGARVVCADVVEKSAAAAAERIGKSALACRVDVSVPADVERMVADTIKAFGKLDVLYANAGIGDAGTAADMPVAQWDRMIAVNLTGVWLSCKYALPHMIEGGGGSIVNQASIGGVIGVPGIPHYAAAKAGVIGLTRQIAVEYGPKKIRANAICPGTIFTPLVANVWKERGVGYGATGGTLEEQKQQAGTTYPLQRLGEVADCANLALFLASDESSWITGTAMPLDGGRSAG